MAKRTLEFVCVGEPIPATRGLREALSLIPKRLDVKRFRDQLDAILDDIVEALPTIDTKRPKYQIDTVEFSIVVDVDGSLRIFGSGVRGGIAGGIKVTLKGRPPDPQ